jgi:hypothetical protein
MFDQLDIDPANVPLDSVTQPVSPAGEASEGVVITGT